MKKLIALALGILGIHSALAQGTVQFQNTALSPITTNDFMGHSGRLNASMNIAVQLYWGTSADSVNTLAGVEYINPASPGILAGNTLFAINGAAPLSTVFLEIRLSDTASGWLGRTEVLPFQLGAPQGPGTVLFGSATTSGVFHSFGIVPIPEPSTMALAGLGAACLFCFRRRKSVK